MTEIKCTMSRTEDGWISDTKVPAGFTVEKTYYTCDENANLIVVLQGQTKEESCQDNSVGREGAILNEGDSGNLGSCAGSNPAPGDTLEPYEKRRAIGVYNEVQAIEALAFWCFYKDVASFGISKYGYRITVEKV